MLLSYFVYHIMFLAAALNDLKNILLFSLTNEPLGGFLFLYHASRDVSVTRRANRLKKEDAILF